jgi:hypothetical protein
LVKGGGGNPLGRLVNFARSRPVSIKIIRASGDKGSAARVSAGLSSN